MRPVAPPRLAAVRTLGAVLSSGATTAWPDTPAEWESFLGTAAEHDLLPAAWVAWRAAGGVDLPASATDALARATPAGRAVPEVVMAQAYRAGAERTARLIDAGTRALATLDAAGIPALPLKGLHTLLAGVWADPVERTMVDLDILVDDAHATDAWTLLRDVGYTEHPDPIGEHADHHLAMLARDDVTIELHTQPLVSRWRAVVAADQLFAHATPRDTVRGKLLMGDDTDAMTHLVAHAQLQDLTYRELGLPLRALLETARMLSAPAVTVDLERVRARFAAAGLAHVVDAHLEVARVLCAAPVRRARSPRVGAHLAALSVATASPRARSTWVYTTRLPSSFTPDRMVEEFGPPQGVAWLTRSRARHALGRVRVRLGRSPGPGPDPVEAGPGRGVT